METEQNKTNKKRKTNKKTKRNVLITVLIILVIILAVIFFVMYKFMHLVNYKAIDTSDLDANGNLYNDVENLLPQDEFNQIINILLIGSDSRDTSSAYAGRSDTIIIASINPMKKSMKLISIPRDTYVNIPAYGKYNGGMDKINAAFAYGGETLLLKTINSNFGLNLTQYMTIDFSGMINVVNDIGGIQLTITKDEMDIINQYLPASYALTGKPFVPMTQYGTVTLNGEEALAHSRDRYVGSDFTRASRQRDVLNAIMDKVSKMSTTKQLSVMQDFLKQVTTNVDVLGYTTKYVPSILSNYSEYKSNMISKQIPATSYAKGQYINGIYYFVPDSMDTAKKDFQTTLYEK
ncbi:MAG: LCP family protein [Oscillospiraceae bacterium]|nr:LCP family protein [Oscillospiraceae bacterium]